MEKTVEIKTEDSNKVETEGEKVETVERVKRLFIRRIPQVDQSMTLSEILPHCTPIEWKQVFDETKDDLEELSVILENQEKQYGKWFPLKKDIFRAFDLISPKEVRVVIIGMDPYYQIGDDGLPRPTGCSFSVRRTDSIPVSLKNIFTEIKNEIPSFNYPAHGCLDSWARQGILLLNKCLTVRPNEPGSHGEIWDGFLIGVLKTIERLRPNCIFVLWGRDAQKIKKFIGSKSIILESAHPAARGKDNGFFGNGHFLKINKLLTDVREPIINWNLD